MQPLDGPAECACRRVRIAPRCRRPPRVSHVERGGRILVERGASIHVEHIGQAIIAPAGELWEPATTADRAPAGSHTNSPATTAERAPAGKHIFQEDGSACAGAGAAAQVQAEIGQGRNPGAGGSRPASVAGGPDPGAGGSDPAPGAGPGPPPPARLVACSLGKWHRQSTLGHIRVDSAEVARAPGGGPATSGLNPALCAQASAAPAYRKILDAYTDCILQLAKQGIPEISVAVG